jgi:hypothetical protein
MRDLIDRIPEYLDRRVSGWGRLLLVAGAVLMTVAIFLPLWQIHLVAPQYQEGLDMYIYSHQLVGGNDGQDLTEINNLNHYIGMKPLRESDFTEMQVLPFFFGGFALLALRAAVFARVGTVVDLGVLFTYFGGFSLYRFYHRLYTYAHDLDPKAPVDIEPFMPALIGKNQIANFTQYSFPREGSVLLLLFGACLAGAIWSSRPAGESVPGDATAGDASVRDVPSEREPTAA